VRIILRWIFGKWEAMEPGWSWLRMAGTCEYGDEFLGYIKGGEFLD